MWQQSEPHNINKCQQQIKRNVASVVTPDATLCWRLAPSILFKSQHIQFSSVKTGNIKNEANTLGATTSWQQVDDNMATRQQVDDRSKKRKHQTTMIIKVRSSWLVRKMWSPVSFGTTRLSFQGHRRDFWLPVFSALPSCRILPEEQDHTCGSGSDMWNKITHVDQDHMWKRITHADQNHTVAQDHSCGRGSHMWTKITHVEQDHTCDTGTEWRP